MKTQFTILALLISFGLSAQTATTKDGKIKYTKKVTSTVTMANGVALPIYTGSSAITAKQVAILYDKIASGPPVVTPPTNLKDTIIGNGSGVLRLFNVSNKTITINPGNYDYFDFTKLNNVVIKGDGVNFKQLCALTDMTDVEVHNITIANSGYRALHINGISKNLILKGWKLENINDGAINIQDETPYDGSDKSFSDNIQILNFQCKNIGMFVGSRGTISNGKLVGLIKNFKISGTTIKDCPNLNNGVYMGAVEDYEISNNTLDNVYSSNKEHNALLGVMVGSGKVFGNKATNHWGNLVRCWPTVLVDPNVTVEIYNNTVWNSARYSAFEVQTPPWLEQSKLFKPIKSISVYNNTAGKLNTGEPKYFEGRLIDIYSTHCPVSVYNNLVFNNRDAIISNNMSDRNNTTTKETNNIYKATASEAVNNLTEFKAKVSGVGATQ